MSKEDREYYTWDQFERDIIKIAEWARDKGFKNIYGIPRGGLVLGVKLSHMLDVPLVLSKDDITRQTLVVDDIVETGGTVHRLVTYLGFEPSIASLFKVEGAKVQPDFSPNTKSKWIVFPWETDKSSKYDYTV